MLYQNKHTFKPWAWKTK